MGGVGGWEVYRNCRRVMERVDGTVGESGGGSIQMVVIVNQMADGFIFIFNCRHNDHVK